MNVLNAKKIRLIYNIVFSFLSLAVAVSLIVQVCRIYFGATGSSPYTVEIIVRYFWEICALLFAWLAGIVAGFVLWAIFPLNDKKRAGNDLHYTFFRVKKTMPRLNEHNCNTEREQLFVKMEKSKLLVRIVCAVCCGVLAIVCLLYLLNKSHFPNIDQNGEVATAAVYLMPFVLVGFLLCIAVYFFEKWVLSNQIPLLKEIKTSFCGEEAKKGTFICSYERAVAFLDKPKSIWVIRGVVAAVGLSLLIVGLVGEGYLGVLAKAIAICKQCIGLG